MRGEAKGESRSADRLCDIGEGAGASQPKSDGNSMAWAGTKCGFARPKDIDNDGKNIWVGDNDKDRPKSELGTTVSKINAFRRPRLKDRVKKPV